MCNLTQTTKNIRSQGRVGPPTTSWTSQLRRYVGATSLRLHPAPTQEANDEQAKHFSASRLEGAGQRACTVPTSATNWLSASALPTYSITWQGKRKPRAPSPQRRNGAFIPSPEGRRDFPRRFVKDYPGPRRTIPWITWGLIAINVVVFLYQVSLGPNASAFMFAYSVVPIALVHGIPQTSMPGVSANLPFHTPNPVYLTLITSMFLHAGWLHSSVAYFAHVGGFITGLIITFLLRPRLQPPQPASYPYFPRHPHSVGRREW